MFFFSSRRRHTRFDCDWSSDVCSSDLQGRGLPRGAERSALAGEGARRGAVRGPRVRNGERSPPDRRSEEHTSELQSQSNLVCRLLLEKKKTIISTPRRLYPISSCLTDK